MQKIMKIGSRLCWGLLCTLAGFIGPCAAAWQKIDYVNAAGDHSTVAYDPTQLKYVGNKALLVYKIPDEDRALPSLTSLGGMIKPMMLPMPVTQKTYYAYMRCKDQTFTVYGYAGVVDKQPTQVSYGDTATTDPIRPGSFEAALLSAICKK